MPTRFGEIAYVARGRGEAALFLHGFPLHGFQWRGVVARLAGERRCIAPDLMGMGFTLPASGQGVSLPAQADMAAALLDRLGVESVDVVGNDSGTGIAQLLAVRHPGRVRSMLLTNGDVEPDTPPAALLPFIEMGKQGVLAERVLAPLLANKEAARSPTGVVGLTFTHPARLANADAEYRDTR